MTNATVSKIFGQMADILEILGEDRFRVNSYRKSARILAELPSEADQLLRDGTLSKTPGVGKATVKKIEEYLDKGRIEAHQELLGKIPSAYSTCCPCRAWVPRASRTRMINCG